MDLKLSTNDLRWAHWRNIPPEPKPPTQPFDLQKSLKKIRELGTNRGLNLHSLKLTLGMTKPEAHFWLEAFCKAWESWRISKSEIADFVDRPESEFHGNLSVQDVQSIFNLTGRNYFQTECLVLLFDLLSPSDFFEVIRHYHRGNDGGAETFRQHILPYLTEEDREQYRTALRPFITTQFELTLVPFAGLLGGMDTELENYLTTLYKSQTVYSNGYLAYASFGLNDPEKVQHYIKKHNIYLLAKEFTQAWLAHTELDGLDWIAQSVRRRGSKRYKKTAFNIFKKLRSIEAVPHVLSLWDDPQLVLDVLDWLNKDPDLTAKALMPLVFTNSPNAKLAVKYMRRMVSIGQTEILEAHMGDLLPEQQDKFTADVLKFYESDVPEFTEDDTPEWFTQAVAGQGGKAKAALQWVDVLVLPPLTIDGKRFTQDQINKILFGLFVGNERLIPVLNEHISQQERDDFVWALFENWEDSGTPTKGKWAFEALGKLGGDAIVLKLVPLLKKWPGESKHKRASDGIRVLQEIGTDTALMQINSLAQKMRYKSLKRTAQTAIENIAKARGYSQEELEDRIIPDCGLDKDGKRTFDYGERKFTFVLSSDMKPMIRDEEKGKIRTNLPKPNKKDDEGLSAQAQADWKLIKKQVRDVAKIQAERLEHAMISQRRWKLSDFTELYVQHPLMFHIVRLLVWGGYDKTGALVQSFRIDEDQQIVDVDEEPLDTSDIVAVGVLHVMELDENDRQEWGDILSDYEIIAPFEQLGRKVSTLEADECDKKIITRFAPFKVEPVIMVSVLEKSGWVRGMAMDGGIYCSHAKYYPFADVTAVVRYHGVPMGYWDFDHQGIDECFFLSGNRPPDGYRGYKEEQMLSLNEVSPVVLSETLRPLIAISSKAD